MSGYGQVSLGYASQSKAIKPARKIKRKEMKLSLKQRFRNWLFDENEKENDVNHLVVEEDRLSSQGMRLQIYKASGGFVVETRSYDNRTDRHTTSMHVITENEDMGDRLSKIIMMEALRG